MDLNPLHSFLYHATCPSCGIPIQWGITTQWDGGSKSEICSVCKVVLKKD